MSESQTHDREHDELGGDHIEWVELGRIGFVGLAIAVAWLRLCQPLAHFDIAGFAAVLIGGYPIFHEAFADLLSRRMTMELSMTIALVSALAIGEVFTALVIVFFVLIAEVLEELTVGRGRRAIKDLLNLLPQQVELRRPDGVQSASLSTLRIGDVVLVRPGGRVPVDGVVVGGHSFIDQATITGESMPVEKIPGANVYAGTVNQSGVLEIQTETVGGDTAFGKIIEAVEQAERSRAPVQKTADRLAGYLVYFALICAAFTFVLTHNARSTISVVMVAGACGIAAGTPLAILGAIGRAARHGTIVKGGLYMETLSKVDTVVLDKTGTLTLGDPEVVSIDPSHGIARERLLHVAASALEDHENRLQRLGAVRNSVVLHAGSLESFPSLHQIVRRVQPDECYHLAAQSFVSYSFDDEFSTLNSNINGTHFMPAAGKDAAPGCRFYFAGSSEMFGKVTEIPQVETTRFHPRSAYGIRKVAGFDLTRNYREAYGLFTCNGILRSE